MCDVPMIEFHSLTGQVCGLRRDVIAVVIANEPMGSRIGSTFGQLEVIESPSEVLALIRGEQAQEAESPAAEGDLTCPDCGHFHTATAGPFAGICVGCACVTRVAAVPGASNG